MVAFISLTYWAILVSPDLMSLLLSMTKAFLAETTIVTSEPAELLADAPTDSELEWRCAPATMELTTL